MALNEVSRDQIKDSLLKLGIKQGDGLLIHSALHMLGRPVGGIEVYWQTLQDIVGAEGTIAVPTFNFAFARGEDYDPLITPSKNMGVFSEYVRQLINAKRTTHPLQSLAVAGKYADDFAVRDPQDAFEAEGPFDRMLGLDFKLLLIGAEVQATSLVHYSEQRMQVPYRYWKAFTGQYNIAGDWQQRTYKMFVRDLEIDAQMRLLPIQTLLENKNQWHAVKLNYGYISTCTLADFKDATDELLADDPWALVGNKAEALARDRQKGSEKQ
ncbi:MAG: AAC(3) family N-acetyltransferase [Chloroflexota bacterium]